MTVLCKLKHDIRVESKVDIAKEEIKVLLGNEVSEVKSIGALFKKYPFSVLEDEIIKIVDRMPYLGKIQGFLAEMDLKPMKKIVERSTLLKEIFILFAYREGELRQKLKEIGFNIAGDITDKKQLTPYAQFYIQKINEKEYFAVVRVIPFQEIFECGLEVSKLPKVAFVKHRDIGKKIELMERGVEEGIKELFYHLNNVHDRSPRFGLAKDDIGDYVDWAFSRFRKYSLHFIHVHRAKADARMARMVLNLLDVKDNNPVLDPFCGSGSFIADASMMGIPALGVDINPLSCMVARVKCNLELSIPELRENLIRILKEVEESAVANEVLEKRLLSQILKIIPEGHRKNVLERKRHAVDILALKEIIDRNVKNEEIKEFFYVILSRSIVKEFKKQGGIKNVSSKFYEDSFDFYFVVFTTQKIASELGVTFKPKAKIFPQDILKVKLPVDRVDGILTSPPYFDAINYLDFTSMYSLALLGLSEKPLEELDKEIIGSKAKKNTLNENLESLELPASSKLLVKKLWDEGRANKAEIVLDYTKSMLDVFRKLHLLLNEDKRMIFVVGKYHHWRFADETIRVDGARIISDLARAAGFELEREIFHTIHKIDSGNRITSESILIFRKPSEKPPHKEEKVKVNEIFKVIHEPIRKIKRYFTEIEDES